MKLLFTVLLAGATSLFAADAGAGKAAYDKACKSCHGVDGAPNPGVAKMMKVEMRHLADKEVLALSDAKWAEIIVKGVGKMKATKGVDEKAAADITAYCRTFKKK